MHKGQARQILEQDRVTREITTETHRLYGGPRPCPLAEDQAVGGWGDLVRKAQRVLETEEIR
jgi:hypothetical protein